MSIDNKNEMHRINVRISLKANEWLDKESAETGFSKSTMVMLALEQYIQQKQALQGMHDMNNLVERLERIEEKLDK